MRSKKWRWIHLMERISVGLTIMSGIIMTVLGLTGYIGEYRAAENALLMTTLITISVVIWLKNN